MVRALRPTAPSSESLPPLSPLLWVPVLGAAGGLFLYLEASVLATPVGGRLPPWASPQLTSLVRDLHQVQLPDWGLALAGPVLLLVSLLALSAGPLGLGLVVARLGRGGAAPRTLRRAWRAWAFALAMLLGVGLRLMLGRVSGLVGAAWVAHRQGVAGLIGAVVAQIDRVLGSDEEGEQRLDLPGAAAMLGIAMVMLACLGDGDLQVWVGLAAVMCGLAPLISAPSVGITADRSGA